MKEVTPRTILGGPWSLLEDRRAGKASKGKRPGDEKKQGVIFPVCWGQVKLARGNIRWSSLRKRFELNRDSGPGCAWLTAESHEGQACVSFYGHCCFFPPSRQMISRREELSVASTLIESLFRDTVYYESLVCRERQIHYLHIKSLFPPSPCLLPAYVSCDLCSLSLTSTPFPKPPSHLNLFSLSPGQVLFHLPLPLLPQLHLNSP